MCIIIYHQAGQVIPKEHLIHSAHNHPHGFGMMFVAHDELRTYRTMDHKQLFKQYVKVQAAFPDSPIALHFRRLTDGSAKLENCHPFLIDSNHALMHNGTIYPCKPAADAKHDLSDTRIFNDHIMKELPNGWFENKGTHRLLDEYIGARSKIVVMRNDGVVLILGETKGIADLQAGWDNNIWYSNSSYKAIKQETLSQYQWPAYDSRRVDYRDAPTWHDDGLDMRYNNNLDLVEAWDKSEFRWRSYDFNLGRFTLLPHTCVGHAPRSYKEYYATWKQNEKDILTITKRRCDFCEQQFPENQLKEANSWSPLEQSKHVKLCPECFDYCSSIQ